MSVHSDLPNYSPLRISLHWIIALLMLAAYVIGLQLEELPRGAAKASALSWHLLVGLGVLAFAIPRLWLFWRPPVAASSGLGHMERRAASIVHVSLYAIMLFLPVTGLVSLVATGREIPVLGLFTIPPLFASHAAHEAGEEVHAFLGNVLLLLVAAHILATLWHALLRRDGVAARMIPFLGRHASPQA